MLKMCPNPGNHRFCQCKLDVVLGYRKLSLSIIDNFAIFLVIELSIISAKIIDNSR
jgi:hypothetical protein